MRTFFAIKAPGSILDDIDREITSLRTSIPGAVKWTPKEQMHLTVKFLGSFSTADTIPLKNRLLHEINSFGTISLTTTSIGIFPLKGNPRVIWYGIEANLLLVRLAAIIEKTCSTFGYQREKRPFSPHLTIGRVKRKASIQEMQVIRTAVQNFKPANTYPFEVSTLLFIHSTLTPTGPEYKNIFTISL